MGYRPTKLELIGIPLTCAVLSWALAYLGWPLLPDSWQDYIAGDKLSDWAQVIGTMGSIIAGALVIRWQVEREHRQTEVREQRSRVRELTQYAGMLALAAYRVDALARAAAVGPFAYLKHLDETDSSRALAQMKAALHAVSVAQVPDPELKLDWLAALDIYEDALGLGRMAVTLHNLQTLNEETVKLHWGRHADVSRHLERCADQFKRRAVEINNEQK